MQADTSVAPGRATYHTQLAPLVQELKDGIGHSHAVHRPSPKGFLVILLTKSTASISESAKTNYNFYEKPHGKAQFGNLFLKSHFFLLKQTLGFSARGLPPSPQPCPRCPAGRPGEGSKTPQSVRAPLPNRSFANLPPRFASCLLFLFPPHPRLTDKTTHASAHLLC